MPPAIETDETNEDNKPGVANGATPRRAALQNNDSNQRSVEVDALIALVEEVTALKKEVNVQAKDIEVLKHENERILTQNNRPHHNRHDRMGTQGHHARNPNEMSADFSAGPTTPTAQSQVEAEEGEAVIDASGKVARGADTYVFNESVWDATLFLGVMKGCSESVDIVILGMINMGIQVYFCALLFNLRLVETTNQFEEQIDDFIQWRIGVAHQAKSYDPLTESSLAQRVCLRYGGTIESRRQQNDFERYDEYISLQQKKESSEVQGPGLLMLALALWLALILKEVVGIISFIRMLVALVYNGNGSTQVEKNEDGSMELQSISKRRAVGAFLLVALPRLGIAGLLGWVGVYYLRATVSVEEIILNAMALGFVLEIDELLFSFAPSAARYIVSNMAPVPVEVIRNLKGEKPGTCKSLLLALMERSRALLLILITVVIVCRFTLIAQVQDSMKIAQVVLCDGDLNFVFKQNPASGVVHVAHTEFIPLPQDDESGITLDPEKLGNTFDGVLQATKLCELFASEEEEYKGIIDRLKLCSGTEPQMWCEPCERLLAQPATRSDNSLTVETVVAMESQSAADVLQGMSCVDAYTSVEQTHIYLPFTQALVEKNFTGTVSVCAEMRDHCSHADPDIRHIVRQFCSQVCQCDHVLANTFEGDSWYWDRGGCLPACATSAENELDAFEQQLLVGQQACEDQDANMNRSQWIQYVQEIEDYLVQEGKLNITTLDDGTVLKRPSAGVQDLFWTYSNADWKTFSTSIAVSKTHTIAGCTFSEGVSIDPLAWADTAGSLCKWAQLIYYMFDEDFCSKSQLLFGGTPLQGLCPLSCGLGVCSSAIYSTPRFGSNTLAFYNLFSRWGEESRYGLSCDISNFFCVKVTKFTHIYAGGWGSMNLEFEEQYPDQNATSVYTATIQSGTSYSEDYVCTKKLNLTHPPNYTLTAAGREDGMMSGTGVRWRVSDMWDKIIITAGWDRTLIVPGYDWGQSLQQSCSGYVLSLQYHSWSEMQQAFSGQTVVSPDQIGGALETSTRGMFGVNKVVILGGYRADDEMVDITYTNSLEGPQTGRVSLGQLARPTEYTGDFQDYVGCLLEDELVEDRPVATVPVCGGVTTCTYVVGQLSCATTMDLVVATYAGFGVCGSPTYLDGVNRSAPLSDVCVDACASQTDPAVCGDVKLFDAFNPTSYGGGSYGSYYSPTYYSFTDPHCQSEYCNCLTPFQAMYMCPEEFFTLEQPLSYNIGYRSFATQYRGTAENATNIMDRDTVCFTEDEGIVEPRQRASPSGYFCLVLGFYQCFGSFIQEIPRDWTYSVGGCSWRAASASECAIDPRDTYPSNPSMSWTAFADTTTPSWHNPYGNPYYNNYYGGGYGPPSGGPPGPGGFG